MRQSHHEEVVMRDAFGSAQAPGHVPHSVDDGLWDAWGTSGDEGVFHEDDYIDDEDW